LEEIRRRTTGRDGNKDKVFECVVLGVINKKTNVYAIFIEELGFECPYKNLSPYDFLPGRVLKLRVQECHPTFNRLALVPAVN